MAEDKVIGIGRIDLSDYAKKDMIAPPWSADQAPFTAGSQWTNNGKLWKSKVTNSEEPIEENANWELVCVVEELNAVFNKLNSTKVDASRLQINSSVAKFILNVNSSGSPTLTFYTNSDLTEYYQVSFNSGATAVGSTALSLSHKKASDSSATVIWRCYVDKIS